MCYVFDRFCILFATMQTSQSTVICSIVRSFWADNMFTGPMAHEAGPVSAAPCAGPPRRSLRQFSGSVYKKEGKCVENSRFSADCGARR